MSRKNIVAAKGTKVHESDHDRIVVGDFDGYAKDKGIRQTCPFCDCEDWGVSGQEGTDKVEVIIPELIGKNTHQMSKTGMPMIPLTCANCGYVKLQALSPMLRWKKEKALK